MERDKALRLVETIVSTSLELVRAECGPRGAEALSDAVDSLKGLVNEIFDDNETEDRDLNSGWPIGDYPSEV